MNEPSAFFMREMRYKMTGHIPEETEQIYNLDNPDNLASTATQTLKTISWKTQSRKKDLYSRIIPGEDKWEEIKTYMPKDRPSIFRVLVDNYGLEKTFENTLIVPFTGNCFRDPELITGPDLSELDFEIKEEELSKNPFTLMD